MLTSLIAAALIAVPLPSVNIDPQQITHPVQPSLYGIFFEEINRAGEGGIFAELLNNRSLERPGSDGTLPGWESRSGTFVIDTSNPFNSAHPHSIAFTGTIANPGFWGINIQAGQSYKLSIWAKGSGKLSAKLGSQSHNLGSLTNQWKEYKVEFTPAANPRAELILSNNSQTWIGFTSLMPSNTWGNANLRPDLAGMIADLKPGFIRFPGGCYVEGQTLDRAWDWKASLGSPETRKGQTASFWGYTTSNGLGYHEYLQWCEDVGAEALFVANCGMAHSEVTPLADMPQVVQNALDAIEYANGAVTTPFGAMRAKNGHPKPFNLKYVQVGNENGGPNYNERYKLLAEAIKTKHPEISTIACLWGGVPTSYPIEILDEHYYADPSFFWANANRYDSYDRNGPKIYVGEYAVTRGCGLGNLDAALAEAAFITGMERNADIVTMSSYAPLLSNINDKQWNPNAIVFNSHQAYGTPSYWVQQMFAHNRPDKAVAMQAQLPVPKAGLGGTISLQTWQTQAEFKDIKLEVDGKDISPQSWRPRGGNWTFANNLITQTQSGTNRSAFADGVDLMGHQKIHLSMQAKKTGGDEGFIIVLGADAPGMVQWNLGGWNNTQHAFQIMGGGPHPGAVPARIETGRWYQIDIIVENQKIRGLLDGKFIQEIDLPKIPDLAASAGIAENDNTLVVKLVNGATNAQSIPLSIVGLNGTKNAKVISLSGPSLASENSFDNPKLITPKTGTMSVKSGQSITIPAMTLMIMRIPLK